MPVSALAAALLAVTLAAPKPVHRGTARSAAHAHRTAPAHAAAARAHRGGSDLDRARAHLAQVKRDPAKRRYRHHWEKAIAELEHAARGRNRAPALLEAARARYALYRFSQVESDRDAALELAMKSRRAGSREAGALAVAIRRERGDDEQVAKAPARAHPPRAAAQAPGRSAVASAPPRKQAEPPIALGGSGDEPAEAGEEASAPAHPPGAPNARGDAADAEASLDPALAKALADAEDAGEGEGEAAGAAAKDEDAGPATVTELNSWVNDGYTRVAVALSRPVHFTREELPAEGGQPRRLAIDLAPARLDHELAHAVSDGLVARVRATQRDPDTVRVVLDLPGRDAFSVVALQDPPRLIVDVGVHRPEPAVASPGPAVGGEHGARPRIRRIVVDAGHGGHDTGAIGPTRVREKDVTLAMARKLARELQSRGFEVVLTRPDDRFVPLEQRAAIANGRGGDLFVSLHANAHPRRDRRGVETYVLDVAGDRYARRLAARENGALRDEDEPDDVRRILTDLDAVSSAEASRRLAGRVQQQLCSQLRAHVGDVRDLGVKSAVFYVLLGARMPAVLVETGFISNRIEEQRLRSPRFQQEVAVAVADAVEGFARREERLASR